MPETQDLFTICYIFPSLASKFNCLVGNRNYRKYFLSRVGSGTIVGTKTYRDFQKVRDSLIQNVSRWTSQRISPVARQVLKFSTTLHPGVFLLFMVTPFRPDWSLVGKTARHVHHIHTYAYPRKSRPPLHRHGVSVRKLKILTRKPVIEAMVLYVAE